MVWSASNGTNITCFVAWLLAMIRLELLMSVRTLEIREATHPISSAIANAYIDFSKMTCSLVATDTDAIRDGRWVVGYGFNSDGRYAQGGLVRERFCAAGVGSASGQSPP